MRAVIPAQAGIQKSKHNGLPLGPAGAVTAGMTPEILKSFVKLYTRIEKTKPLSNLE